MEGLEVVALVGIICAVSREIRAWYLTFKARHGIKGASSPSE